MSSIYIYAINHKEQYINHTELHDSNSIVICCTQHFLFMSLSNNMTLILTTSTFMIEFYYLPSYEFLGSSIAIVKLYVRDWLVASYEKEILGRPISW